MKKSIIGMIVGALMLTGITACTQQVTEKAEPAAAAATQQPAARPPVPKPTDVVDFRHYKAPELVAIPVTRTETEAMNCVMAGLATDGRTMAQARDLATGTEATINGAKVVLKKGESYYSLCKGATPEQRLAATTTNLEQTTAHFNTANDQLKAAGPWIYVDPAGPLVQENTFRYEFSQLEQRLERAERSDWFQNGGLIILLVLLAWVFFSGRRWSLKL